MAEIFLKVEPVKGAAEYWADLSDIGTPCIFMCADGHTSVVETAKTIEAARSKANKWQQKENRAVLKSQNII